ncbi:MAG: 16S rRNA (cytidine(1402)-2'-O)-methyltransferase [Victivallales bacterium]|nr:16S rRNA (cytidine(1402)-2'-O)-methyltransferase [Victivallales bacterium]
MSTLYVIATPIGNLSDASPRTMEVLKSLDALACEDTRHTGNLLSLLEIPRPPLVFSNHEFNERSVAGRIVGLLDAGKTVGICSDAGYPLVSDPGYPAVRAAIAAGHEVVPVPGASAVPLALIKSGLPVSSYTFKGFPPRKPGTRRQFLEMERDMPHTLVFYESPFRVAKLLAEAAEVFGAREAAVCLELTKQFERCSRGTLPELAALFANQEVKGEVVVVIAGSNPKFCKQEEPETETSH